MGSNFRLPGFLILGAQKAGTTSLHQALAMHSEVFMSNPKELSFFNREENYRRGAQWYASHFRRWRSETVAGEGTPSYLWDERVPPRIKKLLPDAKFIILLRDPVSRAYSAYWYAYIGGNETLPFEEALAAEPHRARISDAVRGFSSYVDRGLYAGQIRRYFDLFDRSRFLILLFEDYKREPQTVLRQVTEFLGVGCDSEFLKRASDVRENVSRMPRSNVVHRLVPFFNRHCDLCARVLRRLNLKRAGYPPMNPETRAQLVALFRDHNRELETLIGRDLSVWSH